MARGGFGVGAYYTLGAASDLAYIHQTLVFTALLVFRFGSWDGDVLEMGIDSAGGSVINKGFFIYYENRVSQGSPHQIRFRAARASGTVGLEVLSATSTVTGDGYYAVAFSANNSGASVRCAVNGAANTPAGTTYNGTTTGNMTAAARVGVTTAGAFALGGAVARFAAAPHYATADELRAITLGYPLPRRMRSSTAVDVRFGQTPRDTLGVVGVSATGSPTLADNPRLLDDPRPRVHQPQRGLARRMALEGLYVGSAM